MKVEQSPITTPVVLPADARKYLRLDSNAFDDEITLAIDAATAYVEGETESTIALRNVTATVYESCGFVSLPLGPVVSVGPVTDSTNQNVECFVKHDGNDTTVSFGQSFTPPLTITYQAGYANVPADLKVAILELVAGMHRHKENYITGTIIAELPHRGEHIWKKYRRSRFVG